jgi:hypothetical protein
MEEIEMQSQDFGHLTHREWREILRWRASDAKIELDQAVEGRRKAVVDYRAGEKLTLEDWTGLQQAVGRETKARQKYYNALAEFNCDRAEPRRKVEDIPLTTPI